MPDRLTPTVAVVVDKTVTPTTTLRPSLLAAVVEARYLLDVRRR